MPEFEITSSRVVEGIDNDKKFVAYMVLARYSTETESVPDTDTIHANDKDPAKVERRYTHFLDLYQGLKKEQPDRLQNIAFPRKMLVGNFDPSLITSRCQSFASLLSLLASESCLRDCQAARMFFQDPELLEAKRLIADGKNDQALSVLETSFKLLSKVYTDHSRIVLSVLCRIVACAEIGQGELAGPVERWAQLALRRYEGVSDSDLLMLYVPLLHTCTAIWERLGRDKSKLVEELNDLRKRGMNVDSAPSLMEAVDGLRTDL